jgi:hypothetical protein
MLATFMLGLGELRRQQDPDALEPAGTSPRDTRST